MPVTSPYKSRARLARATQTGDLETAATARLELAEHRIRQAIEKAVADAPLLTAEQRAHLAVLLLAPVGQVAS